MKAQFDAAGAAILGVSPDSVESHQRFRDKFELNFPLLADEQHTLAEACGAWREKTRGGKTSLGITRSTFLIDAGGTVVQVWQKVDVEGHAAEVLAAIAELAR